jgi:hypothetical protein
LPDIIATDNAEVEMYYAAYLAGTFFLQNDEKDF